LFQFVNLRLNGININLLFLFKDIYVARDIEIEVVFLNLSKVSNMGIFIDLFALFVAEVPEKIKPEISITYYWKISYRIIAVLIIMTTLRYF
jgi:hypothetical protein